MKYLLVLKIECGLNAKRLYKISAVQPCCGQDRTYLGTSNWNTELRIAVDCGICWPESRGRNSWKEPTDLSNRTGLPCLTKWVLTGHSAEWAGPQILAGHSADWTRP